jgi:hypothetical protein
MYKKYFEKAIEINDLSECGIVIREDYDRIQCTLYDIPKLKEIIDKHGFSKEVLKNNFESYILGFFRIEESNEAYDSYVMSLIAGVKGIGKLLYEIALTLAGHSGISPARQMGNSYVNSENNISMVSKQAIEVWRKFNNRNDVIKKPIDDKKEPFTPSPKDDGKVYFKVDNIEANHFLDKVYYSNKKVKVSKLKKNHEAMKKEYSLVLDKMIQEMGFYYFQLRYLERQ